VSLYAAPLSCERMRRVTGQITFTRFRFGR
jgi:hypothetical protein